jgi:hypothetical protein
MVLLRPMDIMTANHPNANLSVYIDDVGTRCAGKQDDVIKWTVEHAIAVKEAITQAGLRVADDKGQVIAKDARWRNRIAIEAADSVVILKQCRTIKNLGIDFAFGVKSKEPTRAIRLQKAAQRGKRLDTIKSAGIPAARFFKTSSEPVAMYGVGVNGINSGNLYKLRALASGANSRSTAGKNIGLDLLLADIDQYDPTYLAQSAPLKHWANQIWNASNCEAKETSSTQRKTKQIMRRAYEEATLRVANGKGAIKADGPKGDSAVCERTGRKLKKVNVGKRGGAGLRGAGHAEQVWLVSQGIRRMEGRQGQHMGPQGHMPSHHTGRSKRSHKQVAAIPHSRINATTTLAQRNRRQQPEKNIQDQRARLRDTKVHCGRNTVDTSQAKRHRAG